MNGKKKRVKKGFKKTFSGVRERNTKSGAKKKGRSSKGGRKKR